MAGVLYPGPKSPAARLGLIASITSRRQPSKSLFCGQDLTTLAVNNLEVL